MPAHVYIRTGDYEAAVRTNQQAASTDRAYIAANGSQGIYSMMYYSHNLHFIAVCAAMNGNYLEAKKNRLRTSKVRCLICTYRTCCVGKRMVAELRAE